MIGEVLDLLKKLLNAYLSQQSGTPSQEPQPRPDLVTFIDGGSMDPITFKTGTVTILLVNLEEENVLRSADQYRTVASDGTVRKSHPEIRLNLYLLFVAQFSQYKDALYYLSNIIRFFQKNRVFDQENAPELSKEIDKLAMELITLSFSEQNEMWGSLRTTYRPSVLYKVKMVIFSDEDEKALPKISDVKRDIKAS